MKFRVHELAKKYNKTNKDIIEILEKLGAKAKSHLAPVNPELVEKIDKMFRVVDEAKPKAILRKKKITEVKETKETVADQKPKEKVQVVKKKEERQNVTEKGKKEVKHAFTVKSNKSTESKEPVKKEKAKKFTAPQNSQQNRKNKKEKEEDKILSKIISARSSKIKSRRDNKRKKKEAFLQEQQKVEQAIREERIIKCRKEVTVKELADKMGINPTEIVKFLFMQGKMHNVNSFIPFSLAEEVAENYNVLIEPEKEIEKYIDVKHEVTEGINRPPVVTVMGHVDHGKTSLLDRIRSTKVTESEAGGITQKVGAYQVEKGGKKITFIDTPGHEAFMDMRARGASVTDIAVLVVAADDGVMPQTKEAISHAKFTKVPIIVAINKIDKPESNIARVKQELAEQGIMGPEWGGDNEMIAVSALTGKGIDSLLETIIIQAEVLDLKSDPKGRGRAIVIESKLDQHSGPLADIIVQDGTLRVGDPFTAGISFGKIRYMIDDNGKKTKEASMSMPVKIAGFSSVPDAGDILEVRKSDREAKKIASIKKMEEKTGNEVYTTNLSSDTEKELHIIVKAGSRGALEAVKNSLLKIENEEIRLALINLSTGNLTSSDLKLAKASGSSIISFDIPVNPSLKKEADVLGIEVKNFSIIYELMEYVEEKMKLMMAPKYEYIKTGTVDVLKIFKIPKVGTIAGCVVKNGYIDNKSYLKVIRNNETVKEAKILALKRLKDFIARADAGQECGISIENFNDFQEGDIIETYIEKKI